MKRRSANKQKKPNASKEVKLQVIVNTKTWTKDSHGLFDYQADQGHYQTENINLQNQCKIFRDVSHSKNRYVPTSNKTMGIACKCIAGLEFNKDGEKQVVIVKSFYRNEAYLNKLAERTEVKPSIHEPTGPFIVINQYSRNSVKGFPLVPGNIIKLGRVQFLVLQYRDQRQVHQMENKLFINQVNVTFEVLKKDDKNDKQDKQQFVQNQTDQKIEVKPTDHPLTCKICLGDENQEENPLISPCKCKGSCEFLHLECLKTWINSKVKKELHGLVTSYNFTKFECQICKTPFPNTVNNLGKDIQMMTIGKPMKPYIILESLPGNTDSKQQKCLHLITVGQGSSVRIGRGHTSEIRLSDISVSRSHAEITFVKDQYYLRDTNSKFGTLVSFTQDEQLDENQRTLKVQYGRSVFEFQFQNLDIDTQ